VFLAGKKLKKNSSSKIDLNATSAGSRLCIIRIITKIFYLKRSAINLATASPLIAWKDPLSLVSPAR
jgi:hypothetical protein